MIPTEFDEGGRAAADVPAMVAAESVERVATLCLADGAVAWCDRPLEDAVPGFPTEGSGGAAIETHDGFYDRLGAVAADRTAADLRPGDAGGCEDSPRQVDGPTTAGRRFSVNREGETRYYRLDSVPLGDATKYDRLVCLRDVTATVERHRDLSTFERLADRAQDGLYATDGEGRIVYCNDSFAALVGADPASLRGREAASLVAECDRDRCRRAFDRVEPGTEQTGLELAHRTSEGGTVPLSVTVTPRADGGVVAVARDVTERKRRERRLEQYRTLVESAGDPMWVLDVDGQVELCNEAMVELLGVPRTDVVGADVASVVPGDDAARIQATIHTLCDDVNERSRPGVDAEVDSQPSRGGPHDDRVADRWREVDCTLEDADGETRQFEATLGPIVDDGTVVGSVGTFRDVTERERRTTELELLQRVLGSAVRTDVLAGTREIRDRADRLAERLSGTEARLAETIRERSELLANHAAKGAVVDRIVETDPQPVGRDLAALVERSVAAVRDANPDASLTVDVPSVQVRAIPAADLAVRNLVENALEHAGSAPDVRITATVADGAVSLTIADDGPGVLPAELQAIERGAETAMEHGSGVGLWLVDWVVEKSGGDLSFETGDGTRATVTLDRHRPTGNGPGDDGDAEQSGGVRNRAPGRTEPAADAVSLLSVGVDERSVAAVRAAARDAATAMTVESVETADAAASLLSDGAVDCVVTDRLPDAEWSRLLDAVDAVGDVPLLLYTGASHTELDESTLTTVDSLVERGTGASPAAFLVEKAAAVTGANDGGLTGDEAGETGQADETDEAGKIDEIAPAAVGGHAVLGIRTDGETRWPAGSITDLLREKGLAGDDAADALRDRLRRADPDERELFTVDAGNGRRYYLHCRSETGGDSPTEGDGPGFAQVEYLCDVTRTVERGERLALAQTLAERAQDGISVVDADGRIAYHNESFAALLGYDDMVGEHSASFMAEGQLERGQLAVQRLLATPELDSEVLDMDFLTADGDPLTLAVHYAVREADGGYAGLVNVARDVTERKRRERRLEQYRTLVESAGDPMFAVDDDGRIQLANAALSGLIGRSREELRGQPVETVFRPESFDRGLDAAQSLVRGERDSGTAEVWLRDADDERHRYEVTVRDCGDGGEEVGFQGSVWTCRDVTERERRAEELHLLKQVLGRVLRHNLRNELTLVTGHGTLIADRTDGEARRLAREIVDRSDALAATASVARTVETVLARRGDRCVQSVQDVVDAAITGVDDAVVVECDVSDLRVNAHRSLRSALEALLVALDGATGRDESRIRLTAERDDDRVRIQASLEAGDIDREALAAFGDDPDAILDRDGDVGTWLVTWVVETSDGTVTVETAEDRSAVVLSLPRAVDDD